VSFPTTFPASRVTSSLGVKGGTVPSVDLSSYQPVMVMADFSDTISSEPVEARALGGANLIVSVPRLAHFQLQAVGGGGLIIESLVMKTTQSTMPVGHSIFANVINTPAITGTTITTIEIGGRETNSIFIGDARVQAVPGDYAFLFSSNSLGTFDATGLRIFVPPGKFFHIINDISGENTRILMTWRELPEVPGAQ